MAGGPCPRSPRGRSHNPLRIPATDLGDAVTLLDRCINNLAREAAQESDQESAQEPTQETLI